MITSRPVLACPLLMHSLQAALSIVTLTLPSPSYCLPRRPGQNQQSPGPRPKWTYS